jgi:hypothetical protein
LRRLAVGAGKDRRIFVLDRDNLGKFSPNANNVYQEIDGALAGGIFSTPAYFNGTIFFGAIHDSVKAFSITNARLEVTPSSQTVTVFPYPGATPSISANGVSNAILWAIENSGPAVLHAYDATNLANELYNSSQAANGRDTMGVGAKFIAPTVANGKVYVSTINGVEVFGILIPGKP